MKQLLLVVAFLSLALQSAADVPYNAWWQKANRYYQQKQYDSAAYYYEKLSGLNPENEVIYYNLGNTYYRYRKNWPLPRVPSVGPARRVLHPGGVRHRR